MGKDIVVELREFTAVCPRQFRWENERERELMEKAATEIERMRNVIGRYLTEIADIEERLTAFLVREGLR